MLVPDIYATALTVVFGALNQYDDLGELASHLPDILAAEDASIGPATVGVEREAGPPAAEC